MNRLHLSQLDESGEVLNLAEEAGAMDPDGATRRDLIRKGVLAGGTFAAGSALYGMLDPSEALAAATARQKGRFSTSVRRVNRRARRPTANDVVIANYALTLEYLEAAFYAAAVQKAYPDPDIAAAAVLLRDHEQAHVDALRDVLGRAAVRPPRLNGSRVEELLVDQNTFLTTATQIEPVGTAAYAGAGPFLSNLAVTRAALAIHSVEARHAAYTSQLAIQKGIAGVVGPAPRAFDQAFTFNRTLREVGNLNVIDGNPQP